MLKKFIYCTGINIYNNSILLFYFFGIWYKHFLIIKHLSQILYVFISHQKSKAVVQMCSVKKVFLEILQNSQENTCVLL